jgi:hypothetical protein
MKSQLLLTQQLLAELGKLLCTSTTRDSKTISSRFEHEGLSFLTITLPNFASDFQKSLEQGKVANDAFLSFRKHAGLPAFLQGFLSLVFDTRSGTLLDNPSIEAIDAIRQLTLLHGKLLVPCTSYRIQKSFQGYIECENHVKKYDASRTPGMEDDFRRAGLVLFGDVLSRLDEEIYRIDDSIKGISLRPKHGPGSTAERILGNQKWIPKTWTSRLEAIFPARDFLIPNERYYEDLDSIDMVEPGAEQPVRVISVPKTLKSPRVIAIEPVCMQYAQQAISRRLVDLLEGDSILKHLIGFTDQMPNRRLASEGSVDGRLATLDLSSASDLVSNQLALLITRHHPWLSQAMQASRSRKADVPGFGVIRLAKFASMGSALCFPVEAMVFLTVVFLGIARDLRVPVTRTLLQEYVGRVRVYGDDIIVPAEHVRSVVDSLEAFGFLVGLDKSFWNGRFRESCGGDYYSGEDVTPVRCRRPIPTSRKDAEGVISLVAMRNLFYQKGLWATTRWLDEKIERLLSGVFPVVEPTSPAIGRHSVAVSYRSERESVTTHSPLVKGYTIVAVSPENSLDGPAALLKFFLMRGEEPLEKKHLERSGRPGTVFLKTRWIQPF